jgi:hypothetical protein
MNVNPYESPIRTDLKTQERTTAWRATKIGAALAELGWFAYAAAMTTFTISDDVFSDRHVSRFLWHDLLIIGAGFVCGSVLIIPLGGSIGAGVYCVLRALNKRKSSKTLQ